MFGEIAAILMLASSVAQPAAPMENPISLLGLGWKEVSHNVCVTDPGNEYNLYCKIEGSSQAVVEVRSTQGAEAVYDQWSSKCQQSGTKVISKWFPIPANQTLPFVVLSAEKSDENCREVFFTGCHVNGKHVKCNQALNAKVVRYVGHAVPK